MNSFRRSPRRKIFAARVEMAGKNPQPTYKRQRFLLAFIRQLQGGVTSTDLQKLVFLLMMRENSAIYEFIPYKYGSYSFQLAEDGGILRRGGYLKNENAHIQAIGECRQHAALYPVEHERGDCLIRKAYRKYPYYAINSEIIGRIFSGEEKKQFQRCRERYVRTERALFTIGYEGKSVESFINTLILNDIRLLVDVRKNPLSRKFGFSKGKLEHITESVGIHYTHIPDLGIGSDKRGSIETMDDYRCLFKEYAKTIKKCTQQLDSLYSLLCSSVRIALMCYEKDPKMCHRHVLRDYLVKKHEIRSTDL